MRIAVPTEVKSQEHRVALTPAGALELTRRGHEVYVQAGAGLGSTIPDEAYAAVGATLLPDADAVWDSGDLVVKVKEPVPEEYSRLRRGQTLFTYLHLAASRSCTDALLSSGATAIAYETVTAADGSLPLLAPMSEVAGRLAPQAGAYHMMRHGGGSGILPGGVPGTPPASVAVIGAGVSGLSAATVAVGLGADVTVLDVNLDRLRHIDALFSGRIKTLASSAYEIERVLRTADLVIGAVLLPGAKAPTLVSQRLARELRPGTVMVDISIDQGGCFADSRPTTHADPTYLVGDVVFYCVANMPGAMPRTSTYALSNATLPYLLTLADRGWRSAMRDDAGLAGGLATWEGALVSAPVATAHGLSSTPLAEVLA